MDQAAKTRWIRLFAICLPIILLDQATKLIVLKNLPLYESIVVIPGFFDFTHIHNTGGAFGVFAGSGTLFRTVLFTMATLLAMVFILVLYYKTPPGHSWFSAGLALVFSGAIGNQIDRIRLGEVVDFIDWHIGGWHWPAFNIADSAVSVGIVILLYHFVFKKDPF